MTKFIVYQTSNENFTEKVCLNVDDRWRVSVILNVNLQPKLVFNRCGVLVNLNSKLLFNYSIIFIVRFDNFSVLCEKHEVRV